MGLFSALGQIVAAPIIIANTVVKDIKNDNGDFRIVVQKVKE